MKEIYGFELIPFSRDGVFIPGLPASRIERSPHPSLNILAYPALFLMQPPANIVLLRQGGISLTELSHRIISVAFENDWISQQDFYQTQIVNRYPNSGAFVLPSSLIKSIGTKNE